MVWIGGMVGSKGAPEGAKPVFWRQGEDHTAGIGVQSTMGIYSGNAHWYKELHTAVERLRDMHGNRNGLWWLIVRVAGPCGR